MMIKIERMQLRALVREDAHGAQHMTVLQLDVY